MDILDKQPSDSVLIGTVVAVTSRGQYRVVVNNSIFSVGAIKESIFKIKDTVILNRSSFGKLYIIGKVSGLSSILNKTLEVYING